MQKIQPLQLKINKAYGKKEEEMEKAQKLQEMFTTAQVSPLAGCGPALVQIPVFLSLYRSLQNLIAEDKLNAGFLWVPSLEGPVTGSGGTDWLFSVFSGNPTWGYLGTLQFLSLTLILYVCQTAAIKLNTPPRADPDAPLTPQEEQSKSVSDILPLFITFFSLSVPAGLSIYWIANSILTTGITLALKAQYKGVELPPEVERLEEEIDRKISNIGKPVTTSDVQPDVKEPKLSRTAREFKVSEPGVKVKVKVKAPSSKGEGTNAAQSRLAESSVKEQASETSFDAPVESEIEMSAAPATKND
jgi:YidC/Oxa1 family membrane protein insertase